MKADEYTKAVLETVTDKVANLMCVSDDYLTCGLIGECGEVNEHAKRILRDDDGVMTPERKEVVLAKLGDVLWYAAMALHIEKMPIEFVDAAGEQFSFPKNARLMAALACKYSETSPTESWLRIAHIRGLIEAIAHMAKLVESDLDEVADLNIKKLRDQKKRGVLHRSGDER